MILGFCFGLSYSMHVKYGKNSDVNDNSDGGKNGNCWSSSSLSVSCSVGCFGGSSSVMEWSSVEENELVVPFGFSLVVYAWRK